MCMSVLRSLVKFYVDGFRSLSGWARTLWIIIILKIFILFFVFKLFFFRDTLENKFGSDEERVEHVIEQITQ